MRSHVRRYGKIGPKLREHRIALVKVVRKWIAARVSRPWIIQADVAQLNDGQTEWRHRRRIQMQVLLDEIMSDSCPDPDRCLPVTRRIPGQRQSRIDIPVVALNTRLAVEAGVTRISEARRSIGNHRASLVGIKPGQAEIVEISLRKRHGQEWLPADTVGQRQLRTDFPGVLSINSKEVLVQVQGIRIGLPQLRNVSKEKVRHAQARYGASDRIRSTRPCLSDRPLDRAQIMCAEGELVRSLDDIQIVIGTKRSCIGKGVRAETGVSS